MIVCSLPWIHCPLVYRLLGVKLENAATETFGFFEELQPVLRKFLRLWRRICRRNHMVRIPCGFLDGEHPNDFVFGVIDFRDESVVDRDD